MRVVVLGGAGDMGSAAVRYLCRDPRVSEVIIADRDVARASVVAGAVQAEARAAVRVVGMDAMDPASVHRALAGAAVAAGALGPFYLFERRLVQAAIEAGVNYVSLCDDHDAAREALALDPEARQRGVTVITGLGWTPGLSNVLARVLSRRMGQAESVRIAWAGSSGDSRGYAVVLHTLHIFTGQVPTFRDGQLAWVAAGSEPEQVPFPPPLGPVEVRHVGHPEPLTLPAHLPGVQEVSLKGGLTEALLNRLAVLFGRSGLAATPARRHRLGRAVKPLLPALERIGPRGPALSGLYVRVRGRVNGRPEELTATAVGHMAELTALPLALGAALVGTGAARRPGVHPPEADGLLDHEAFIAELRRLGLQLALP